MTTAKSSTRSQSNTVWLAVPHTPWTPGVYVRKNWMAMLMAAKAASQRLPTRAVQETEDLVMYRHERQYRHCETTSVFIAMVWPASSLSPMALVHAYWPSIATIM